MAPVSRALFRANKFKSAGEDFRSAQRNCLKFFNRWMGRMAAMGDYSAALSAHKDMVIDGITPNFTTLDILVKCFTRINQVDHGLGVLSTMMKMGFVLDVVTYTNLMQGLVKKNRVEEAISLLRKMEEIRCTPDQHAYHCIMNVLFNQDKWLEAMSIFEELEGNGITPDSALYQAVIDGLSKSGKVEEAKNLYDKMRQAKDKNCKP